MNIYYDRSRKNVSVNFSGGADSHCLEHCFNMHNTQGFTNNHNDARLTKSISPTWHYGDYCNE